MKTNNYEERIESLKTQVKAVNIKLNLQTNLYKQTVSLLEVLSVCDTFEVAQAAKKELQRQLDETIDILMGYHSEMRALQDQIQYCTLKLLFNKE